MASNSRNTINQRIALEGGDEIIAMLKSMGKEGEEAAKKLERAFANVKIGNNFSNQLAKFKQSFANVQQAGAKFAGSLGNVKKSLGDVGSAVANTRNKILLYTGALTGAAAAGALFLKGNLDKIGELNDLASSIGVTTDELQGLIAAGAQAGIEGNDFIKTIGSLSETMQELNGGIGNTTGGMGKVGTEFKQVGDKVITIHRGIERIGDSSKKSGEKTEELSDKAKALQEVFKTMGIKPGRKLVPLDVFKTVADAFSKMEDGAKKTQLAIDIFGIKLGPRLIPLLNQGGDAVEKYVERLNKIGALLTKDQVRLGDAAGDQIDLLTLVFQRYSQKFSAFVAPSILRASDLIFSTLEKNGAKIDAFLQSTGEAVGTFIEDIVKLATGMDDSQINNKWIIDVRDAIMGTYEAAKKLFNETLIPAFKEVRAAAEPVAKKINEIFGTKLTGDQLLIGVVIFQLVGGFKLLFSVLGLGAAVLGTVFSGLGLLFNIGKLLLGIFPLLGSSLGAFIRLLPGLIGFIGPQGLIALAVIGLGAIIYTFWDDIVAGAKEAFRFLKVVFSAGWEGIKSITTSAFDGLRQLLSDSWSGIKTAASSALSGVSTVFSDIWSGIKTVAQAELEGIKTIFADAWAGITGTITQARDGIVLASSDTWNGIKQAAMDVRAGLITVASDTWAGITETIATARDGVLVAATQTWSAITEAASGLASLMAPIWEGVVSTARDAFNGVANIVTEAWSGASANVVQAARAIKDAILQATSVAGDVSGAAEIAASLVKPFIDAKNQIREVVSSYGGAAAEGFRSVIGVINSLAQSINAQINAILTNIRRAILEAQRLRAQAASASTTTAVRKASGGYISGSGTATSDSIPAWLSNGEYVIKAAAVRKYGVSFFNMLNGMVAGAGRLRGLPAFAAGGLVNMPRFSMPSVTLPANNNSPASSLTLVLGDEIFSGLTGSPDTISRLEKAVRVRKVRSTGRASPYGVR